GPDAAFLGPITLTRGVALRELGRHREALAAFERAFDIDRAIAGDDAPQQAETLDYIGASLVDLGRAAEAIAPLERAVALRVSIEADPYDLAIIRLDL